jgi:hypothetical protein
MARTTTVPTRCQETYRYHLALCAAKLRLVICGCVRCGGGLKVKSDNLMNLDFGAVSLQLLPASAPSSAGSQPIAWRCRKRSVSLTRRHVMQGFAATAACLPVATLSSAAARRHHPCRRTKWKKPLAQLVEQDSSKARTVPYRRHPLHHPFPQLALVIPPAPLVDRRLLGCLPRSTCQA